MPSPSAGYWRRSPATPSGPTDLTSWTRAGPRRVAADEAEHPGLDVGVVRYRHLRAVLAGLAEQLVDRLHAGQQIGAERRGEPVVLAGGAGQVPGVHEHVGDVEAVDRLVQWDLADVRVGQHAARRGPVVEHRLHRIDLVLPGGHRVVVDRGAGREPHVAAG